MNHIRCIKTSILIVAAVTMVGCKSKQEAPATSPVTPPQNGGEIKSISGQNTAGGVATSPQDKADAEAAAKRVLARMEAGDFAAIYNDAGPGFKKIGSEGQFVALFQQKREITGPLKDPRELNFITRPDYTHVLTFSLENNRFRTERRLTLARAKSGKMELVGLNQHDEPKQHDHPK
jgi:hypothetical protein